MYGCACAFKRAITNGNNTYLSLVLMTASFTLITTVLLPCADYTYLRFHNIFALLNAILQVVFQQEKFHCSTSADIFLKCIHLR